MRVRVVRVLGRWVASGSVQVFSGSLPRGIPVRATVTDWEHWTGLHFPESGRYILPGAFQPIRVDRSRNHVAYLHRL